MRQPRIAIVGAGIGGLGLALALLRRGIVPQVYEQATQLGEIGAGISVSPNAVKALADLGLGEALRERADEPPRQRTCHFQTGATLIDIDRSDTVQRYGAPYYQMHRADLHGLLVERIRALAPEALSVGRTLTDLRQHHDRVELTFESGSPASADALIAADGWRSRVRSLVFGVPEPQFSGYVAWRGLVPMERLDDPTLASGSRVSIGPGRLFVHYPVRRGRLLNFVAFARTGRAEIESWSQRGSVSEVAQTLADFHQGVHAILAATPDGQCHKWGLFARAPLPQWTSGRVALLGDAAHPMMPWFGQGAASALEDAVVLARCIVAADDLQHTFARYQDARLARVTMVHNESLQGGERLAGARPDLMSPATVRNEDTLGLFSYDPVTTPI